MQFISNYRDLTQILATNQGGSMLPIPLYDFYLASIFKHEYGSLSFFIPDGMPVVVLLRFLTNREVERMYGPDVMLWLINKEPKTKHLFLGSLETLKKMKTKWPQNNFSYYQLGYSQDVKDLITADLLKKIKNIGPKYVWIGVGSPKQVILASMLKELYPNTWYMCVGAAFDFISRVKPQAPGLVRNSGFEWLFRLLTEPKRLWQRYLFYSPIGLARLLVALPTIKVGVEK